MRINVNAFIAVVLCTALLGGLWLLNTRTVLDDGVWNPHDMYNSVGGSEYVLSNGSSERSASSGTVLSLSASRTLSRKASSVPYSPIASSPYSPIASSPYNPITSSPISYASSAAQFHSFGGGSDMMGGVAGGSFRANLEAMPSAASLLMPSMPNYAMVARGQNAEVLQGEMAAVSAISEAATAYSMPIRSSITTIGGQLYQIGTSGLSVNTPGAGYSVGGRRYAHSIGGSLDTWLQGIVGDTEKGWMDINDGSGISYFDEDVLRELYLQAIENGDLPSGVTWEQFLLWFGTQGDKYDFPMPDGEWLLLVMAFAYTFFILYCKKCKKIV